MLKLHMIQADQAKLDVTTVDCCLANIRLCELLILKRKEWIELKDVTRVSAKSWEKWVYGICWPATKIAKLGYSVHTFRFGLDRALSPHQRDYKLIQVKNLLILSARI